MSKSPYSFMKEKILLKTCSTDLSGLWRLSDILVEMQELAGKQCQRLGCGRQDLIREYGLVWVLTRTELHISRMPSLGETVEMTTWAAPPRRMIYPRYFSVTDEAGRTVAESATQWVLCSVSDRRMADVPAVGRMIPTPDREPPFRRFTPVPAPGGERVSWTQTPRYSDLDANGHVNNTRYADWLCDALGVETMKRRRFSVFTVEYRHEVLPGDSLEMTLAREGDAFSLSGVRDGTPCFDIGGVFMPQDS